MAMSLKAVMQRLEMSIDDDENKLFLKHSNNLLDKLLDI